MMDRSADAGAIEAARTFPYPRAEDVAHEADMVMKGGITSGIVYPLAVCEVAKTYRLKNVGGSSAGGIAAAFAAAAERNRDGGGFGRLAELPLRLGDDLGKLFQPSPETAVAFGVLSALIDTHTPSWRRIVNAARRLAGGAKVVFGLTLVVVLVVELALLLGAAAGGAYGVARSVALGFAILVAVGTALGAALVTNLFVGAVRAARAIERNGHGLCVGSNGRRERRGVAPFTDWMHQALGEVAGLPDQVVRFRDLWGPVATAEYERLDPKDKVQRDAAMAAIDPAVRLEMMTTNVTFARPMRVPWTDDTYLVCPQDMRRWFPSAVAEALLGETQRRSDGTPVPCPHHPGQTLHKLPAPPDVPVVFAIRLTLSFPGLISAVPLYAVDFSGGQDHAAPVRCWFSDGGISSNFPIHFFDRLLPRRPTFAINLLPYHAAYGDDVSYPKPGTTRQPRVRGTDRLAGFAGALLDTLQNWSDEAQAMLPGFDDRIVNVHLREDEGGMNLDMSRSTVLGLAARGGRAGALIVDEFDFQRHRTTRYRTAMGQLQRAVTAMRDTYDSALPGGEPGYRALAAELYPASAAGADSDGVRRTDLLIAFAGRPAKALAVRDKPDFTKNLPRPPGDLRITPHF